MSSSTFVHDAWYTTGNEQSYLKPVQDAYQEATEYFQHNLTEDDCKKIWTGGLTSMEEVEESVLQAKQLYEQKPRSPARKWLSKFSGQVMYYGAIMDTMSQHHPEYVSLVWGAMKFLFIGILNHEEMAADLSRAMSAIADILPQARLDTILYPTQAIKRSVAFLNAKMINFLARAITWYKESALKHLYHSITRPAALRIRDLVKDIKEHSERIGLLAASASRAELRDVRQGQELLAQQTKEILFHIKSSKAAHLSISTKRLFRENLKTRKALKCMESKIITHLAANHGILLGHQINTNQQLYHVQFSQILTYLDTRMFPDTQESLRKSSVLRHQLASLPTHPQTFSRCAARLRPWAENTKSSMILLKGSYSTRHVAKIIAHDLVCLIQDKGHPVVCILNTGHISSSQKPPTTIDIIKHIVLQVMKLNKTQWNERATSLNAASFQCMTSEKEWFGLLAAVLVGLPYIFFVVDIEVMGYNRDYSPNFFEGFLGLFQELLGEIPGTKIKIVIVSYNKSSLVPNLVNKINVILLKENQGYNYKKKKQYLTRRSTLALLNEQRNKIVSKN